MNKDILRRIIKFRNDRNWAKFHTGENLAKSISIEANELLEVFQWNNKEKSIAKVEEELADVFIYAILMADKYDLDIDKIINKKLDINEKKYPIDKSFGNAKKHDEF
jgi:NTP pyrophosphatase (non-canonical NTP hydrolase)